MQIGTQHETLARTGSSSPTPLVAGAAIAAAVATTTAVGVALIPAGRVVAWIGLLAVSVTFSRLAGLAAGTTAAVTAGLVYLAAHGQPRFDARITDPATIRLGFLLALAAALGALWAARNERHDAPDRNASRHRLTASS